MMTHLSEEQINELADESPGLDGSPEVDRHLAECLTCRGEIARTRALLRRAKALPAFIEPPENVWPLIAAKMHQPSARGVENLRSYVRNLPSWGWLAAAALLLVVLSSAVTSIVVERRQTATLANPLPREADAGEAVLVTLSGGEDGYRTAADELWATVNARRDQLSPETIATVERSVLVIDAAINEAREALANDPNNPVVSDMLSASYQRKVDLLKRATELLPRS